MPEGYASIEFAVFKRAILILNWKPDSCKVSNCSICNLRHGNVEELWDAIHAEGLVITHA